MWIRGGKIKIFRRKIFVSQCRKFRRGTLSCLTNFGVPKNFMNKKREGVSRFSVENFLSRSAKNFRRGTLWCFINFGYRKCLDKKGGNINIFRRKLFVSGCRKNS